MVRCLKFCIVILVCIPFGCIHLKQVSLDQQVNLELIKKIEVKQENFKLKLRTNGLNVSLPKDIAIAHINYYLDEISGDSNLTEQFDRQTEMKKLLLSNDEFEILNVYELDSFIKMDILEAIELQTNNTEYGFYYYFRDFFVPCLIMEMFLLKLITHI